jgi:hypothetical protein
MFEYPVNQLLSENHYIRDILRLYIIYGIYQRYKISLSFYYSTSNFTYF